MEFSKEHMEAFLLSHAAKAEMEAFEWVWSFVSSDATWTTMQLHCALRYMQPTTKPERLEVIPEDAGAVALEVEGPGSISNYLMSETPSMVPCTWKKRVVVLEEAFPAEMPISVTSRIVDVTPSADPSSQSSWDAFMKRYRLVKEFEFDAGKVIYRARMVRESRTPSRSLKASGVMKEPVKVEFDMVCKKGHRPEDYLGAGLHYIQTILDNPILLGKQQQSQVLEEYDQLVKSVVTRRYQNKRQQPAASEQRDAENEHYFLAPKPITMEQIHLIEPGPDSYGIMSIWKGYAVTDKADGERMLFYISHDGRGYLINNTFDVMDTGLSVKSEKLCNTLLDGEFVTIDHRKDDSKKDLFAAFDIYFLQGKSVMDLPLFHATGRDRVSAMKQACDPKLWDASDAHVEVRYKEHYPAEGGMMKDACKALLGGSKDLPYEIDGLIFTPSELSVFGYYPGISVPIPENVKWDRVLKWKPAEQNTIDFLVQLVRTFQDPGTKQEVQEYRLFTGYNASQWEHISPMQGLQLRYDKDYARSRRAMGSTYRAEAFRPLTHYENGIDLAHVVVGSRCKDGSVITHDSIVEFGYTPDPSLPPQKRWVPLRVREDKTRIFQRMKTLSKTANDRTVALSIWRSIHAPVTHGMITGVERVPVSAAPDTLEERLLGTDDVYYAREIPRQHMLSVHMLNFHNQGVKRMLYEKSARKNSLLELACGMAGDMPRWRDCGYRFVLGVDLVKDNITNPRDGAYARMLRQNAVLKRGQPGMAPSVYSDIAFAVADCAKPLKGVDGQGVGGLDDESKQILRIVYQNQASSAFYHRFIAGKGRDGFNVVSCMFAMHYFFQSEEMLDGFLYNVASNLQRGGTFIATFMDGDKVEELLEQSHGIAEGRKLDGSIPVWAIIRRYQDAAMRYGKVVEVFLENTNRLIPEYLIHLDTLEQKAAQHGLELEETKLFSETFEELRANAGQGSSRLDEDIRALDKDKVQKQFSFLNRWVVFRSKGGVQAKQARK